MLFFKNEKYREVMDLISTAGTVGLHLVSATFVGLAMGWALDHYLEKWFGWKTSPWFLLGMLLMGIVAGFRNVYHEVKRIQRAEKRGAEKKNGPGK
jgi:ATP synthase protein I